MPLDSFDFAASLENGRFSARTLCYALNLGWATLSRYLDGAERVAQILAPNEEHFSWVEERTSGAPRQNVYLSPLGGVALMSALPGRIPGKSQGLKYFLEQWGGVDPLQENSGSGFVLILKNKRSLIRFGASRTPMAPRSSTKKGTAFECRVVACVWSDDPAQLAQRLSDHFLRLGCWEVGDWYKIPAIDLLGLPAMAGNWASNPGHISEKRSA